jgi:hypothetical protein
MRRLRYIGVGEATLEILRNDSTKNPDLSERFLFEHGGGNCNSGAQFERMLSAFENPGTVNATCAPYYPDTSTCPNWQSDLTKLNSYTTIKTAADAKQWIATKGPVMAGMIVYTDFFDYTGGIYSYQYGDVAGNHAITLIGYNDVDGYWIGKNSWSTEWEDNGFFKTAYGQCGIGSDFYFYGENFTLPGPTPPPTPANPDLTMPATGKLYAQFKFTWPRANMSGIFTVNGKPIDTIADMKQNGKTNYLLGSFIKGQASALT